jgi:two-component system, sporulation sensor kinase E
MSRFVKKALEKAPRIDKTQLESLLALVVAEHELYEASLHSLPSGILVLDTAHRILFHNKAAERLVPFVPGFEGSDKPAWTQLRDADVADFLRRALETDQTSLNREFVLDAPGGPRVLAFGLMPLVLEGRIQGSMLQVADVTERKSRESRLRRAESLASLTTLAAGVAHEIKNPLGSMGIHIQLIQRALKAGKPLDESTLGRDLEVINEEINRLNGIVVDFLFAVRPMDTTLILGSLNKVVAEMVDFLEPELAQAGIRPELQLEKKDDTVLLDERFLKQALLNLVKNSMHAMEGGGKLTFRTKTTADGVTFQLIDTGAGIPEDVLEKIFEPYFTTKDFGSGLGLTLVYKIVKEHGADIQVQSKVGQGTTITIAFPPAQRTPALLGYTTTDEKGEVL